ncbi:MAG: hydroxyacid dehydrogenase [Treponema sp.]|jgi:phosphoglycerate dehydrogenase-like enzyme|nr:hydroxyacid dehydrogenase [Treponema sp.]
MKAVFTAMGDGTFLERVYDSTARAILAKRLDFIPPFISMEELERGNTEWKDVEFFFSTWGTPQLNQEQLERYFPRLQAVFYAAGSVQNFARPYLERGIRIFSAADANAVPVIEFTTAEIILANKGFFQSARLYSAGRRPEARQYAFAFPGNYDTPVGIIGAGKIGSGVIRRLKEYRLDVKVFDPFLKAEDARELGAEKIDTLEELFKNCLVISNHLANNEQTQKMLNYRHFSLMWDYGVFINTGRGAQVVEDDLVRALTEKPSRTAVLDVTFPEPVPEGHPFYTMDNVILTPHIAGSNGMEVKRMGMYMAEEFERYITGSPLRYEVTLEKLATMA